MDPKNTDEAPSSSSFPQAHEGAPDPSPSSSSLPGDSTLRRTSPPPPSSSSHPAIPSILHCNFCEKEFDDYEVFFEHIMCEHPGQLGNDKPPSPSLSPSILSHGHGPSFNCFECEEVFGDFQDWLDHSANSHPFEPPLEPVVPQSPEAAPPQEMVVRLIRCTFCGQTFLPQERMCPHVMSARAPVSREGLVSTGFICHLCGQRFAFSYECRSHVWEAHRPIIAICGLVMAQQAAGDHRPSTSSAWPREAAAPPSSSSVASAAGQRLVHAALQGQEEDAGPRFNCRSCSSSFASGSELTNHVSAAHPPITCGRAVSPQPPAGSGVSEPVVGAPAQEAAEPSRETPAADEFLSILDSGGFLVDVQSPSPPPNDG